MDKFTPQKRSEIMSLIRSKNTKPELVVYRYLREQKVYFQKHYTKVVGSPDVALPRKKKAVFIDGDFWHGATFEKRKDNLPAFWTNKIICNMKRDRLYRKELRTQGWQILRIWESDVMKKSSRQEVLENIKRFLLE